MAIEESSVDRPSKYFLNWTLRAGSFGQCRHLSSSLTNRVDIPEARHSDALPGALHYLPESMTLAGGGGAGAADAAQ